MKASKSKLRKLEYVPTGIPPLDALLNGGVYLNRITQFSGAHSTGKSNTALEIVKNAQKQGLDTLWMDSENRYPFEFSERLGVNLNDLEIQHQLPAEELFDLAEKWIAVHRGVVILDSIGGLMTRKEMETKSGEEGFPMAPRLIAPFLRRVANILPTNGSALVCLNHEKIDFLNQSLKTLGGKSVEYHVDQWVRFRRLSNKKVMQGDKRVGDIIEASVMKGPKKGEVSELTLLAGVGFFKEASLLDDALAKGVIKQTGRSYFFGEEKIAGSMAALREALKDSELANKIREKLTTK